MKNLLMDFLRKRFDNYVDGGTDSCEEIIYREYNILLEISLVFGKLKPWYFTVRFILLYVFIQIALIYFVYIFTMTAICARSDDFVAMVTAIDLGLVGVTFLFVHKEMILHRSNIALMHSIIGKGVYDYKELNCEQELDIKERYVTFKKHVIKAVTISVTCCGLTVIIVGPLLDTILTKTDSEHPQNGINYDLPVPLWLPYESNSTVLNILSTMSLGVNMSVGGIIYVSVAYMYFNICINIACQIEILIASIRSIENRALLHYRKEYDHSALLVDTLYSNAEYMKCVEYCFKQNVEHHLEILRLHAAVTETYSTPILVFYFLGGIMMAMTSFAAVTIKGQPGDVLAFGGLTTLLLVNIAGTCFIGQFITDFNEKLRVEIYSMNWYHYSKSMKLLMEIIQEYTIRDLVIQAPFNFAANLDTFAGVLNTAYSYFSLIIAWNE